MQDQSFGALWATRWCMACSSFRSYAWGPWPLLMTLHDVDYSSWSIPEFVSFSLAEARWHGMWPVSPDYLAPRPCTGISLLRAWVRCSYSASQNLRRLELNILFLFVCMCVHLHGFIGTMCMCAGALQESVDRVWSSEPTVTGHLWTSIQMLGINPVSLTRATHSLNHCAIAPVPRTHFL